MIHGNHAAPAPSGTRVVITGAGGNIGRGLAPRLLAAGYQLTLSDLKPVDGLVTEARFAAADVRTGEGLQAAMVDADILVHLPALHGIHVVDHTETEFWNLNVNGTFRTLQAAVAAGVGKVVWLSSQAWHDSSDVYGFTKVIGEQLLTITGCVTASPMLRSVLLRWCPGRTGPVTMVAVCSTSA